MCVCNALRSAVCAPSRHNQLTTSKLIFRQGVGSDDVLKATVPYYIMKSVYSPHFTPYSNLSWSVTGVSLSFSFNQR